MPAARPLPMPSLTDMVPLSDAEAFDTLRGLARGKTGAVPVDAVITQVMAVTAGGDWPLRRAALDAILRRRASMHEQRLKVAARPKQRTALGFYAVASADGKHLYRSWLGRFSPIAGSCECADFVRSSLGLCKHLWAALEDAAKRGTKATAVPPPGLLLTWDPVRPLTGKGDPLERVRWAPAAGRAVAILSRWFAPAGSGPRPLISTHADEPNMRLSLVRALLKVVRPAVRDADEPSDPPSCDPALATLLAGEEQRLRRITQLQPVADDVPRLIKGVKHRLYPYQIEGVRRIIGQGRFLLADDMGLGKTAQAISTCHALWTAGRVKRGLIVVPAALKPQWLREWEGFTDVPIAIVDGSPEERKALYARTRSGFLLTNYEQVRRDLAIMQAWDADIVVLDEAQRIKNWQTRTAASVKRLSPPFRLVLTGTPFENRLDELASVLEWVDDQALEPKWRLGPWHTIATDGKREARGARNLATLRERLSDSFLRRRRQEVLDQLPERSDTRVPVELTPRQAEEHDERNQPISQLMARAARRPLTQAEFLRLMQLLTEQRMLCNGWALSHFEEIEDQLAHMKPTDAALEGLFMPKLIELRELISQLVVEQGLKVVVFSQWRRMLLLAQWATSTLLGQEGLRAVWFSGAESQKRRTHNIIDFHDDPATRVLFATDAGGVGLNLQHAASACINLELPWNPAVLEQRIGRIYRMGQKRPVEIYNLVAETGIEARIAGLVADKRALFSGLFDGTSDEVTFEGSGSFLARVQKLVDVKPPDVADDARDDEAEVETEELPSPDSSGLLRAADSAKPLEAEAATIDTPSAEPSVTAESSAEALTPAIEPTQAASTAAAGTLRAIFGRIRIEPRSDGGVTIDAPPEAAATLAELFGELAKKLAALSG